MSTLINLRKQVAFALFLFCSVFAICQPPYPGPYNMPGQNLSGTFSGGTHNLSAPTATLSSFNLSTAAASDVTADYYIHMQPNTTVENITTGLFHAHIDASPIQVVSYHPNGFSGIPLYDKYELGVQLPADLTQKVNDFFGEIKIGGLNGYGCHFNQGPNYINPYDPDQISVEATFSFPGQAAQTIYGFYYREYSYSTGHATPTYATDWVENTNLQYHWRVRFAPRYVGTYTVTWIIRGANNQVLYQDNVGQTFTTVSSSSLGFLKMGAHNFFVAQPDQAQPERTILPIGMNVCHAGLTVPNQTDPLSDIPNTETKCSGGEPDLQLPENYYKQRELIRKLAQNGGNYARLLSSPDNYEIEWEVAGVYDARPDKPLEPSLSCNYPGVYCFPTAQSYKGVNRQAILWEMDQLLDMAKENNIYIQWIIEAIDNGFYSLDQSAPTPFTKNWKSHPYVKGTPSVISNPGNTIDQFFTDVNAKKMHKKKLRYLFARYGYSTSIVAFELWNEIHLYGAFLQNTSLDAIFKPWLEEMTNYIRTSPGLNHTDHLLTASFNKPDDPNSPPVLTQTALLPGLDFLSMHKYSNDKNLYHTNYNELLATQDYYGTSNPDNDPITPTIKPIQLGETGLWADYGWFRSPYILENMSAHFHTLLWASTFIGGVTSGLEMWQSGLDVDPNQPTTHPCGDGFVQHFKPLQAFIKDYDFNGQKYVPKCYISLEGADINDPGQVMEAFYLIDNKGYQASNAIGYIHNRTFFCEDFINPASSPFYDPNLYTEWYNHVNFNNNCGIVAGSVIPSNSSVITGNLGTVTIKGLIPTTGYDVNWYNTYIDPALNDPFISPTEYTVSSSQGELVIHPPTFSGCTTQEYGFKIVYDPIVGGRRASTSIENHQVLSAYDMNIYPNPGTGKYTISVPNEDNYEVEILNAYGATIRMTSFKGRLATINIEDLSDGVYTFIIKSNSASYTKKVMKQ